MAESSMLSFSDGLGPEQLSFDFDDNFTERDLYLNDLGENNSSEMPANVSSQNLASDVLIQTSLSDFVFSDSLASKEAFANVAASEMVTDEMDFVSVTLDQTPLYQEKDATSPLITNRDANLEDIILMPMNTELAQESTASESALNSALDTHLVSQLTTSRTDHVEDFDDAVHSFLFTSSLKQDSMTTSDDEFGFDVPEVKPEKDNRELKKDQDSCAQVQNRQNVVLTASKIDGHGESSSYIAPKIGLDENDASTCRLSGKYIVDYTRTDTNNSDDIPLPSHSQNKTCAASHKNKVTEGPERDVIRSCAADWENVETIEAGFSEIQPCEGGELMNLSVPMMSFTELWNHFQSTDHSDVKTHIRTSVERSKLSALCHVLFGPPKLHKNLLCERDLVFSVAASPMDKMNDFHTQSLQTIYRILTGSRFSCRPLGSHWEEIGFQGQDPATDLRGAGMLGPTQLLYLLQDPNTATLARDLYKLSLHPTQNFPFCIMCINISRICIQVLREGSLNKECNKQQSVITVVNQLYAGSVLHLYRVWKQGKTIGDSGFVIHEIETQSKKNTTSVLKELQAYMASQKMTIPGGAGEGDNNFFNVVKPDSKHN